jgi:UDP-N-acetylglucosamine 2-epimerase (non-hydrolysing)
MLMRVVSVVGTRASILELAAVARALAARSEVTHTIVHAGPRDDPAASPARLAELGIARPDHALEVDHGTPGAQTALIMQRLEPLLCDSRPDIVLVYGDDNATLAAALVAAKAGCQVGHVGAGLRSGEGATPGEINRVVTDRLADFLFAPSRDAMESLRTEAVPEERAHFVGNLVIDTAWRMLPRTRTLDAAARRGLESGGYALVLLQDPAALLPTLAELARSVPVVLVADADSRRGMGEAAPSGVTVMERAGYVEMLSLVATAALVVTDCGTLQDETTYLGVPCLTVGSATERAATCRHGTNRLVPPQHAVLLAAATRALARGAPPARPVVERWDGHAAERIAAVVCDGAQFPLDPAPVAAPDPMDRPRRRAVTVPAVALTG